jgi:NADH-quinone oxidoreductase subunit G
VLRALGAALGAAGFDFTDLSGLRAGLKPRAVSMASGSAAAVGGEGLEVVVSQAIYRTDGVVRRAAALQAHPLTKGACVVLHPSTAKAAGLLDGGVARVRTGAGTATLPVAFSDQVAEGCVWIESGYGATAGLNVSHAMVEGAQVVSA